jgi:hypothetical protein
MPFFLFELSFFSDEKYRPEESRRTRLPDDFGNCSFLFPADAAHGREPGSHGVSMSTTDKLNFLKFRRPLLSSNVQGDKIFLAF